jgi:serine/threonine protein kinase/tetratricopeptide (TPR) repeat protein
LLVILRPTKKREPAVAIKCPTCHFDNPVNLKFCGECGTKLDASAPGHPSGPEDRASFTRTLETGTDELARGTTFAGRYEIIEELGAGGMGRVYRAQDTKLNEEVALKLIKPEIAAERRVVERFRNELKTARKITHKNVCRMYDFHEDGKTLYLTMEYVRGEDLKSLIHRTKALTVGAALAIARQVAGGLAEAHKLGIVHRDLKPGNIMIDRDGNAKVMDFGIARVRQEKGITGEGAVIGTPEYMSPEQVEGKGADARSDIYALGVILFEMLVGRAPFEGETPFSIANKHKTEPPPIPKKLVPQIPEGLNKLILRCLEKDRAKRYQTAEELVADISAVEQALPATDRIAPRARTRTSHEITVKFTPRRLIVPAAALILVIAIIMTLLKLAPRKAAPPIQPGISAVPAVAILYFKNNTGDKNLDIWREGLSDCLITKLSQSRSIRVLDQSQVYGILQGLNLLGKNNFTPDELTRIASRGLATHIVQGSLSKAGDKLRINLTLENPSTHEITSPDSVDGTGEASIFGMVDELANRLKANLGLNTQQIASEIERQGGAITRNSPEAYKYYLQGWEFSQIKGLPDQSIPFLEKAVAADPQFAMAYFLLAVDNVILGRLKESRTYIQKAFDLRQHVSERERYTIEAEYYQMMPERIWDKAIDAFTKLLNLYPWDGTGNGDLGYTYSKMEEWDKAIERYEVLRRYNVSDSVTYFMLSFNYLAKGQIEKAREVLEGYLNKFGDNSWIRGYLGSIYYILGNVERAKTEIERAYALTPELDKYYKFCFLLWTRDYAAAEPLLQEIATSWGQVGLRSVSLALQGKLKEANISMGRDIEASSSAGDLDLATLKWLLSSHLRETTGDLAGALSACDSGFRGGKELENICDQCQALYRRGVIQARQNDLEAARKTAEELQGTAENGPAKKRIYYHDALMGLLALKKNEPSQAQDYLQKAAAPTGIESSYLFCPRPEFLDYLAEAYAQAGRWPEAQKTYEEIQSLKFPIIWEPANAVIYVRSFFKLGQVLERKGDKAGAATCYGKFLELWKNADPGLPEVTDAKKRLAGL